MPTFYVKGIPAPGGSKSAFPIKKGGVFTGKIAMVDAGGHKNKAWRQAVKAEAVKAMMGKSRLSGALRLHIRFFMPRPKSHFTSKGVIKGSAPKYHLIRPDTTKLVRSTEDAMTGIVYEDDAQIVLQEIQKSYSNDVNMPGALIELYEL